jgi:hypothetical protein
MKVTKEMIEKIQDVIREDKFARMMMTGNRKYIEIYDDFSCAEMGCQEHTNEWIARIEAPGNQSIEDDYIGAHRNEDGYYVDDVDGTVYEDLDAAIENAIEVGDIAGMWDNWFEEIIKSIEE